jgi:hypothetical protein
MNRDQVKRLKEFGTGDTRLRRALLDLTLDKIALTKAVRDQGHQENHPVDGF